MPINVLSKAIASFVQLHVDCSFLPWDTKREEAVQESDASGEPLEPRLSF